MTTWPHDDPESLAAFYGNPDHGEPGTRLVPVVPPFKMYYDGKPIKAIQFHKKAAPALLAALNAIWNHYGRDQATIDRLGISKFNGAYNPRKIRGSATRWSNHAYGAAIDLNADDNGFGRGHGTMPQPVVDAFKAQGALWGGDYHGRTDPMHFEFCSRNARPVGFMDTDSDSAEADENSNGDSKVATKEPWYKKVWTWVSGGGIGALGIGGSWLSGVEPLTIAIILGFAFAVFCIVWFTKKGNGW
jgi:hypothetical protein